MEILEIDSSWALDQDIYQNSSNSSSTSTIPTLPDTITSDNRVIDEANDFLADEDEQEEDNQVIDPYNDENLTMSEDMETSKEVSHEDHQNKTTIYVPNLAKDSTKGNLLTLFRTFGPIKQIHFDAKHGPKGKDAIIIFSNPHNARSAMLSMNLTMFKYQELKICMSNKKGSLAIKNKPTISPISKLCTMVQEMQNATPDSNKFEVIDEPREKSSTDILEISKLTIKKSNKQKFKFNEKQQKDNLMSIFAYS